MKCFSFSLSFCQSLRSWQRSISSAVQKEARCFLYISKMEWYWMGKRTNLWSFSLRMGSQTQGAENGLVALMFKQQIIILRANFQMGLTGFFLIYQQPQTYSKISARPTPKRTPCFRSSQSNNKIQEYMDGDARLNDELGSILKDLMYMQSIKKMARIGCKLQKTSFTINFKQSSYTIHYIIKLRKSENTFSMGKISKTLFQDTKRRPYKQFTDQKKNRLVQLVEQGGISRNQACKNIEIPPSTGKKYLQQVLPLPPRSRPHSHIPSQPLHSEPLHSHQIQETPHEVEEDHEQQTYNQNTPIFWVPFCSEAFVFFWQ